MHGVASQLIIYRFSEILWQARQNNIHEIKRLEISPKKIQNNVLLLRFMGNFTCSWCCLPTRFSKILWKARYRSAKQT